MVIFSLLIHVLPDNIFKTQPVEPIIFIGDIDFRKKIV